MGIHDPAAELSFDPAVVDRLSAELQQMALRWLSSTPLPDVAPGTFGADPRGAELSAALPVFLARVLEARARCCALLDAASAALGHAAGMVQHAESGLLRPGAPR